MDKKKRILISSLLVALVAGTAIVLAYFSSTDSESILFKLANKYTLEYHANAGDDDNNVSGLPEKQSKYKEGDNAVVFDVAKEKPLRPEFVFTGWYDKENPTQDDTKYGDGGTAKYTATQEESHLYAQWTAGYTLIYDANGGANAPSPVTAVSNQNTHTFNNLAAQGSMTGPMHKDPENPEEQSDSNRIFLGWSTNPKATEPEYSSDGKWAYTGDDFDSTDGNNQESIKNSVTINVEDTPSKTVTLYAVWATKYELSFAYHPDMNQPKCGDPKKLQKPMTLVSVSNKAPTFNLITQAEADDARYTPTREEGYRWGWWGDNLERFKFKDPAAGQTAVQAGNEGCYQFGEPVPARQVAGNSAAPNWDEPTLTLYAYFQPPEACFLVFDDNTSNTTQFPDYADRNNTYTVSNMPDNAGASTTEITWVKKIPDDDASTANVIENLPTHPRYVFLGWSEDKNSKNPEYQPGDMIEVNKVLKNRVTLYAIWKNMHKYRLNTSLNGGTYLYYIRKSDRTWQTGSSIWFEPDTEEYETVAPKYMSATSYTWNKDYFSNKGIFATRNDDTKATYKFLGWSWKQQNPSTDEKSLQVDFTVDLPDDPSAIKGKKYTDVDPVGVLKEDVTVKEETPCTRPTTHTYTLYAVWRKSPLHQLRVIFDKGDATEINGKGIAASGNDIHTILINGTQQGVSTYYASLDYPQYTWDANYWSTKTPSAKKAPEEDGTATYTFLGWTTDVSQKTPSTTITKEDIDYPIDDNGKITNAITVKESATEAKDCAGGIHGVTLYPVFRKNMTHVYKLNYDANVPSTADGVENKVYKLVNDEFKEQKNGDTNITKDNLYTVTNEMTNTRQEWDMTGVGLYATSVNTKDTSGQGFTFLGWSYTKYDLNKNKYVPGTSPAIEFPVTAPDDPTNPQGAGIIPSGSVVIDVDEQNPKPADACTDDEAKVHEKTLYGVWVGEPLHQYSIIFAANSDKEEEDDVKVLYGTKDDFSNNKANESASTISKTYEKDGKEVAEKYYDGNANAEIALTDDIKNTYRVFSDPYVWKENPKTDSHTFEPKFWKDSTDPDNVRDLIVKAKRDASPDTRYIFTGWNTQADGNGTDIVMDADGYITTHLEVKDTAYDDCDSYTHNIILYAQWKEVKIHNFRLIFSSEGSTNLGYTDNGTWKNISPAPARVDSKDIREYLVDEGKATYLPSSYFNGISKDSGKLDAETNTELGTTARKDYTWGDGIGADTGEEIRLAARKSSDNNYVYEFLGWSKDKKDPATNYTTSDVDYTVNSDGYIQQNIKIEDPGDPCEKATHVVVLYPVFKKTAIHNFQLVLNTNGGSGIRSYNSNTGAWTGSSGNLTLNYPNANGTKTVVSESSHKWTSANDWANKGYSAYRNQSPEYIYEFVGWSKKALDPSDNPVIPDEDKIAWTELSRTDSTAASHPNQYVNGFITGDIEVKCDKDPCEGGNHTVNIYAVWKRVPRSKTFTLNFDANGGVNPPNSMTTTTTYDGTNSWNTGKFTLTNQQISESGMKNKRLAFVGWHENKNADQGKYGEPNRANDELLQLTQLLTNPYPITVGSSTYSGEKTLYAIWWFEYLLEYDANGGSGAPEHEHVYTSDTSYNFRISNDKPTHAAGYKFLGWSTKAVAAGQGTESDVEYKASTSDTAVRYLLQMGSDKESDDYGYAETKLYAVWGPAN